jgi:hypothetical protein
MQSQVTQGQSQSSQGDVGGNGDVNGNGDDNGGCAAADSELSVVMTKLRGENASLQRALVQARADIASLEIKVGRGAFDAANTRVLHLTDNPEKRAVAQVRSITSRSLLSIISHLFLCLFFVPYLKRYVQHVTLASVNHYSIHFLFLCS